MSYMNIQHMSISNLALFGVPRSGTSWLGQIFNSSPNTLYKYQPLFSYEFKDYLNSNSTKMDIDKFHKELIDSKSEFVNTNLSFPKENTTHLIWKEVRYHNIANNLLNNSDIKIIYIKRNPIDVINSWYNAPKEFNKDWDIESEWRYAKLKNLDRVEEFNGFEKWLEANKLHELNKTMYPNRVFFVDYNELKFNTLDVVRNIFNFAGLHMSQQTIDFIKESKSVHIDDTYGVYKTHNTNNNLPKVIIDKINELWKG